MEFWEYMDKVGMMHVGQGGRHPLHIDYIHMGALFGFIQDVMVEAILEHPNLNLQVKGRVVKVLGKILWIQNGKEAESPTPLLCALAANELDLLNRFAGCWVGNYAFRPLRKVVCP